MIDCSSRYPSISALMRAVRRTRLLRGMKQSHLAEMLGVGQSSVSKWESGLHLPAEDMIDALARFVANPPGEPSDTILKRLVEQSSCPVHLVCDETHRLLAASRPRRSQWRLSSGTDEPMWRYATDEIRRAEGLLAAVGWRDSADAAVVFTTSGRDDPVVPIEPGTVLWERIPIGDHRCGRLVTTLLPTELPSNTLPI
jgi:transcriptional regulator with XRE-family HTH domain